MHQSAEPIADYADTAGRRRKENDTTTPSRSGDPAKAARAMITAVESTQPPRSSSSGKPVARFRDELDTRRAELDASYSVSSKTSVDH